MTVAVIDTGMFDLLFFGMFLFLMVNSVLFIIIYRKFIIITENIDFIGEYLTHKDK